MNQNRTGRLRIIKDISEFSHSALFFVESIVLTAIIILLLSIVYCNLWKYPFPVGDDTAKLIKDYTDLDKRQIPISSWMNRVYIINGSNYTKSILDGPYMIDIIFSYSVCNIRIVYFACQVIKRIVFDHPYFILAMCKKKFGIYNFCTFLLASVVLCTLTIYGPACCFELMIEPFKDTLSWIDSRVYDATFSLNIDRTSRLPHPFTMGLSAPYFLYRYHRYLLEDVVFTCEFMTSDVSFIYKRTQWRKNGAPLRITNDRIFVNVTMNKLFDLNGMVEFYIIVSKLTIQLLDESDFGSYTCEYQNPYNFIVRPGPSMGEDFTSTSDKKAQPMTPDPKCSCKPKEQNYEICKSQTYVEKFQCFAEFDLLKREEKVLTKSISPGSIVISSAFYSTISGSDDVEIQIANKGDENEANCCSKFIEIYWRLFRGGGYFTERPPFTRILHDENGLYFYRYQCMCKSSFGTQEFKFSRNFFNTTLGKIDMAEIIYPIKHKLFPQFTTPWSSTKTDDVQNGGNDDHISCYDTDLSSHGCVDYFKLFESGVDMMFINEYSLIFASLVVLMTLVLGIYFTIKNYCIKPILSAILYFNNEESPFYCAIGKHLKNLRRGRRRRNNDQTLLNQERPQFQIYLSYDEENEYDLMIAEYIKGKLLSMNISVFDFQTDVLPGRSILTELENAIINSSRFVVITSKSYEENKSIEFDAIQTTIFGQGSRLKDRLLIIKSEECDIERLYLVPCIPIPEDLRARNVLDENIVRQFLKWEKSTKPHDEMFLCNKSDSIAGVIRKPRIIVALLLLSCLISIIVMWFIQIGMK